MFAVVSIAGKQYKVSKSDVLEVDHLEGKAGDVVTFDHVLMIAENDKTAVGTPSLKGASVKAKIMAQEKGDKVHIRRYKSKVRHRRSIGFRPSLTRLEILDIGRA